MSERRGQGGSLGSSSRGGFTITTKGPNRHPNKLPRLTKTALDHSFEPAKLFDTQLFGSWSAFGGLLLGLWSPIAIGWSKGQTDVQTGGKTTCLTDPRLVAVCAFRFDRETP